MVLNVLKCLCFPGSNGPECKHCKDDPKKTCCWCNCKICGIKQDPDKQLLCDECDMAYHTYCLNPPLTSIPEDEDWLVKTDAWMCTICKLCWLPEGTKHDLRYQLSNHLISYCVILQLWLCSILIRTCTCYYRYCPGCRNDASEVVLAGEKLKESKKKAKMASASSSSQRDWGKVSGGLAACKLSASD